MHCHVLDLVVDYCIFLLFQVVALGLVQMSLAGW